MSTDPKTIADSGNRIYAEKYQQAYEANYPGQYAAIDVQTEEAFVAPTPEAAIRAAQAKNRGTMFHLIKIGSPGVFRVGYSASGVRRGDWVFGQ
jgi:hypothetical protein